MTALALSNVDEEFPATEQRIVAAIADDEASALFFLRFGGSPVYIARDPKGKGAVEAAIGLAGVRALCDEFGAGHLRVPLGTRFLVIHLFSKGMAVVQIARAIRKTDVQVRTILNSKSKRPVKVSSKPLGTVSVWKPMKGAAST